MTTRTAALSATLLLALGAGCSSSANKDDDGCPSLEQIDPTAIIDDMENPDFLTAMAGNRGAAWWAGGDEPSKALGAAIEPADNFAAEAIPGGRCGSTHAVHVTGHGFNEWAVASVSFGYGSVDGGEPNVLPYDASFRTGIDFWARIGDTSTNQIRVEIPDRYSSDAGGICDKTATADKTKFCYDHFGALLTGLSTEWRRYRIPFLGLGQEDFGIPREHIDTTALYSIDFSFPNAPFDFWIDDLYFY